MTNNVFLDGYGYEYIKPEDQKAINRKSVYALIYIKDINKFVLIIPEYAKEYHEEFYKLAGGGVEDFDLGNVSLSSHNYCSISEKINTENYDFFNEYLEALNRELIEETNYPLNNKFQLKYISEYNFNFKPIGKEVFWINQQRFCYFEVDKLKDTCYPLENWISELEGTDIVYLDPDYVFNNLNKIHVTVVEFIKDIKEKFFKK